MALCLLVGCSTIAPGNDPVVVRAEQATTSAFDVVDAFLLWEHNHPVPDNIHAFAEKLRTEAPGWFATARALTKAYKANRTPEKKAALGTALAVLETAVREATHYLARPPPPVE